MKLSVYFVGGTTVELDIEDFRLDPATRILACHSAGGFKNYVFPLENVRYWRMTKQGTLQ